jgi:hypothetical protein
MSVLLRSGKVPCGFTLSERKGARGQSRSALMGGALFGMGSFSLGNLLYCPLASGRGEGFLGTDRASVG